MLGCLAALIVGTCALYLVLIERTEGLDYHHPGLYTALFMPLYLAYPLLGNRIELDAFDEGTYVVAGTLSASAAAGLVVSTLILTAFRPARQRTLRSRRIRAAGPVLTGFATIAFGYGLWVANYSRLGTWSNVVAAMANRIDRNEILTAQLGNYPYTHFLFFGYTASLAAILDHRANGRWGAWRSLLLPVLALSPLLAFYLLEGERSGLLKYAVATLALLSLYGALQLRGVHILLLLVGFAGFAALGNLRSPLQLAVVTGDYSPVKQRIADKGLGLFVSREFSALHFTLTRSLARSLCCENGRSYAEALPYLVPRSLYWGTKPPTISDRFALPVQEELGRTRKLGFGMSPVAEAYINFGYAAPFLVFWGLGFVLRLLRGRLVSAEHWPRVIAVALLPGAALLFRSQFAGMFSYVVWMLAIGLVSAVSSWLINSVVTANDQRTAVPVSRRDPAPWNAG